MYDFYGYGPLRPVVIQNGTLYLYNLDGTAMPYDIPATPYIDVTKTYQSTNPTKLDDDANPTVLWSIELDDGIIAYGTKLHYMCIIKDDYLLDTLRLKAAPSSDVIAIGTAANKIHTAVHIDPYDRTIAYIDRDWAKLPVSIPYEVGDYSLAKSRAQSFQVTQDYVEGEYVIIVLDKTYLVKDHVAQEV